MVLLLSWLLVGFVAEEYSYYKLKWLSGHTIITNTGPSHFAAKWERRSRFVTQKSTSNLFNLADHQYVGWIGLLYQLEISYIGIRQSFSLPTRYHWTIWLPMVPWYLRLHIQTVVDSERVWGTPANSGHEQAYRVSQWVANYLIICRTRDKMALRSLHGRMLWKRIHPHPRIWINPWLPQNSVLKSMSLKSLNSRSWILDMPHQSYYYKSYWCSTRCFKRNRKSSVIHVLSLGCF